MPPYWDPQEVRPKPGSDAEIDIAFIREHWTPHLDHDRANNTEWLWQCDRFDPQARTCTAYEDRPPVCRNYPWYRDGPTEQRAGNLPARCSLLWDVPREWRPEGARPLIPLEVVRSSGR